MASGLAHEIRNPLVAIKTHVQLMPEGCTCAAQDEQREFATVATREIHRIDALLDRLMEMRDFPRASFVLVDLQEVVRETLLLIQPPSPRRRSRSCRRSSAAAGSAGIASSSSSSA